MISFPNEFIFKMDDDEYFTIDHEQTAEIRVKGSRFIGNTCPVNNEQQATEFIHQVSQKFYNATHNCFAYHIGLNPTMISRYSDAGEPTGTAGLPILNVIKGKQLTNLVVVITRYFGGTKLGKGGLVRAYSECTQQVFEQCSMVKKFLYQKVQLEFDYSLTGIVMRVISLFNANVYESYFEPNPRLILLLRKSMVENFKSNLIESTSGKILICKLN